MKKHLFVLIFILLLTLLFASCNNYADSNKNDIDESEEESRTNNDKRPNEEKEEGDGPEHSHVFGEWNIITEPTCVEEGRKTRICECGKTEEEIIAIGEHQFDYEITVTPSMTDEGKVVYGCLNCDFAQSEKVLPSLDNSISTEDIDIIAEEMAMDRITELINVFKTFKLPSENYLATEEDMKNAIKNWSLSADYKKAVALDPSTVTTDILLQDYNRALEFLRLELEQDYNRAQIEFNKSPYIESGFDDITSFMYMEGYVSVEYGQKDGKPNADKTVILSVERNYPSNIYTIDKAIEYVHKSKIESELHIILSVWSTAMQLKNLYFEEAKIITKDKYTSNGNYILLPGSCENNSDTYIFIIADGEGKIEIKVKIPGEYRHDPAPSKEECKKTEGEDRWYYVYFCNKCGSWVIAYYENK